MTSAPPVRARARLDFTLLDTALIAHGKLLFDSDIQLASLDHALWFHRPFRADEWLLYAQDSPSAHGARGFCCGNVFTRDGLLIASVAQEGLMRKDSGLRAQIAGKTPNLHNFQARRAVRVRARTSPITARSCNFNGV